MGDRGVTLAERVFLQIAVGQPPTLIGIASWQIGSHSSMSAAEMNFGYVVVMFLLIPQVVTVLGLLLWATPIVHSELEAQTWGYAVVRPGARRGQCSTSRWSNLISSGVRSNKR